MTVQEALPGNLSAREVAQWRDLADEALHPNPFADPRFLVTSIPHHPEAAKTKILMVRDAGRLIAVLPIGRERRRFAGLRFAVDSSASSFSAYEGERFHPLVSPGHVEQAAAGLVAAIPHARAASLREFARIPAGGALEAAILAAAAARRIPVLREPSRPFAFARGESVPTDDGSAVPLAHLRTTTRKKLRRLAGQLSFETGGVLTVSDDSDDPEFASRFLDLQAAGWKGNAAADGKAFRGTGLAGWFHAVTEAFQRDGRLAGLTVRSGDRVVYMTVDLLAGRTAFGFHDAYAQDLASFSPGALGRLAELRALLGRDDIDAYDPSMDDAKYPQSTSLYPDEVAYTTVLVGVGTPGSAVLPQLPRARRLNAALRAGARSAAATSRRLIPTPAPRSDAPG